MSFAEKLKFLRKSKGLTQMQLAASTNISLGVIADIESGRHNPSKTSAINLANYFNVPVQVFILEEEIPPNKRPRTFAEKLKLLRNLKHMTQSQLAAATSISLAVIAGVESGRRPPSKEMAKKLSCFFDVPIEIFISEKIDLEQSSVSINIPTKIALEIDEVIQRHFFKKNKQISIEQRAAIIEAFFANDIIDPAEIEKLLILQDSLGIEQILANE